MLRVVFCVLVLGGGASMAAAREYDDDLRSANQLRKQLDYEAALAKAQAARKVASSRAERRDAAILTGVLLYELGRVPEAKAAFRDGLAADLDAPAPANASPKLLEDFERERAAVKRRPKSTQPLGTKLDEDDAPEEAVTEPAPPGPRVEPVPVEAGPVEAAPVEAPPPQQPAVQASGSRVPGIVAVVAGLGVLGLGVGFELDAQGAANALRQAGTSGPTISIDEANAFSARGKRSQIIAVTAMGVGAVALAVGAVLAVLAPGGSQTHVSISLGPNGAGLAWSGAF